MRNCLSGSETCDSIVAVSSQFRKLRRLAAGFLINLFLIFSVACAETLTLEAAVNTALKQNPEVKSAKESWESAKAEVPKSFWLPDPKLGADFERIPAGSTDFRQAEMRFYNFSQEIPWPGMLWAEGNAAAARAGMKEAVYKTKSRFVAKSVKAAYYELAKIDELLQITSANVELARQAYKAAQTKYSSGNTSQVDVLKMQIELNKMEIELQNMKDEKTSRIAALNVLLNNPSDEALAVDKLPETKTQLPALDSMVNTAYKNSPKLLASEQEFREAQAMVGSAQSTYLPETMVKVRNQRVGTTVGANNLMLEFSVPLWFPLRQNYTLAGAYKNQSAKESEYRLMKNMLYREVKDMHVMTNNLSRKLKLYDASLLQSSQALVKASLSGYKSGKIDFLDLLDSFRTYFDIYSTYYETKTQYLVGLAGLEEIIGVDINGGDVK